MKIVNQDSAMYLKSNKAFSFIEIMSAIIIIGVLAAIALVRFNTLMDRELEKRAFERLLIVSSAMEIAKIKSGGSYPMGVTSGHLEGINTTLNLNLSEAPFDSMFCDTDGTGYFCCVLANFMRPNQWVLCYQTDPGYTTDYPLGQFFCNSLFTSDKCPTCAFTGCGQL